MSVDRVQVTNVKVNGSTYVVIGVVGVGDEKDETFDIKFEVQGDFVKKLKVLVNGIYLGREHFIGRNRLFHTTFMFIASKIIKDLRKGQSTPYFLDLEGK